MNNAALVRVRETGTDLLEIEERTLDGQRTRARQRVHVAAGKILEHDVMKRRAGEIDRCSVSETIDDVRMTNAIERDCFVLKIINQRPLEIRIGLALEIQIQRLDHDRAWRAFSRGVVIRDVDFGVTPAAETFEDVVAVV